MPVISPLSPFSRSVLPNGLTVLIKEVTTTPIVAVYFWVRVGSGYEPPELNGISHFFEHMFFKGTEKRRVGEMDRIVKELGGYNNAFTGLEYTAYYVVVPREGFSVAFDLLLDAMRHSVVDPEEIERERQVILEEINRQEDTPLSKLHTTFLEEIFRGIPYERPILGTQESLGRIGRDEFLAFLHDYYTPNNVTIAIVGDLKKDRVLREITEATLDWRPKGTQRHLDFAFLPGVSHERVVERDLKQVYWVLGFPNLGRIGAIEDVYVLDVASTILGGGRSSRLRQRLVEREGIAISAGAWAWPLDRAGIFGIEAEFPEAHHDRVCEEVFEEVERMRQHPVDPVEVQKARTMLKAEYAYANETDSDIAGTLGRYETLDILDEAIRYNERIDLVTPEQIQDAMTRLCNPETATVCVLRPKG
ncbi:MAG: insulinase family protein [Candidatus Latescibacteria bacterium]|nr:insulinase family protein [Candidatus Latescibacterota bacterium]